MLALKLYTQALRLRLLQAWHYLSSQANFIAICLGLWQANAVKQYLCAPCFGFNCDCYSGACGASYKFCQKSSQ